MPAKPRPGASPGKAAKVPQSKKKGGPSVKTTKTVISKRKPEDKKPPPKDKRHQSVITFEEEDEIMEALDPVDLRCYLFARAYLDTFSAKKAALRIGITEASSATMGRKYWLHPTTQKFLKQWLPGDKEKETLRRDLVERAMREADPEERPDYIRTPDGGGIPIIGAHRARISGLELASKLLGIETSTKGSGSEKTGPRRGVIVMPMTQSRDEWKAGVKQRQLDLKAKVKEDVGE